MSKFKGRVAVHAITWGQEHLQALKEASRLGYKAIEPWPSFIFSRLSKPLLRSATLAG